MYQNRCFSISIVQLYRSIKGLDTIHYDDNQFENIDKKICYL